MNFPQILRKNRGCGLYSGATCSPENTVTAEQIYHLCYNFQQMILYLFTEEQCFSFHDQKLCILLTTRLWHICLWQPCFCGRDAHSRHLRLVQPVVQRGSFNVGHQAAPVISGSPSYIRQKTNGSRQVRTLNHMEHAEATVSFSYRHKKTNTYHTRLGCSGGITRRSSTFVSMAAFWVNLA